MNDEALTVFDAVLSALPTHEDFISGKIKVLAYVEFEGGRQSQLWSDRESDGEVSDTALILMAKDHGVKIKRLAIFKLYRVFDATEEGGEGKDGGTGD